ncbi:FtsK/SpoIIIE domain-containing protein [Actinoalloteichus caeruleus]|uniref:DNA segregation ATPase FtsK/SpoIIIE, S-DNA-T family n=1 Tax=Actinoalloteichus caeruleus DSM 43889 TaxID=1120930 RepID=A0ABT1JG75_ACTCY|nr:FtsK/SpoIIIE domain-containing protein [Actinoalloteichus caeruleus]MCP2331168.1 DNA segregation ATPase FtsK/SpoIIIE, S-DNA-T family [Actinoalloteichus caeruleus DSM 43889]
MSQRMTPEGLGARLTKWRSRSAVVPLPLRPTTRARRLLRDGTAEILRSPARFLGAVLRGLVTAYRSWRRWVRVRDYADAARDAGKFADKFTEIRALSFFRWKVTLGVIAGAGLALAVLHAVHGPSGPWCVGAVGAVALAALGRRGGGLPGRRTVLAGPRILRWSLDPQVLVDAFRDAKLLGNDETLRLVERATRAGEGWTITVDLPATRKAADVVKNREALASALAVDEVQLIVNRVRGRGGHAGRVALWVADRDPYSTPPTRTPLVDAEQWDVWRPVPFGRDPQGSRVDLPLVWTSLLIGAIPRQGKTFAARLAVAGAVLDPHARLYVADFKAGKDWDAAGQVAHRFLAGDDTDDVFALLGWLIELISEVQGRYRRMRTLDDTTCPESKLTPAISRDDALNMPVTVLVVDEVQVPLENRTSITVEGRKLTTGEYVGELLTWLAKKGPAAGIVLILATQRPDSRTIPSGLRAVLGSRFALRVMDWRDSNMVLGEQMNTRGYDSSRLLAAHKGVGILRPDGEISQGGEVLALTVRTYYLPNEDWRTICARGRQLRGHAGRLTGYAAGHDPDPPLSAACAEAAVPEARKPARVGEWTPEGLPEPLASVVAHLGDELGEGGREFVPTAELVAALGDVDPKRFARTLAELGCRPVRDRVADPKGGVRQVRGYLAAELRTAVRQSRTDGSARRR